MSTSTKYTGSKNSVSNQKTSKGDSKKTLDFSFDYDEYPLSFGGVNQRVLELYEEDFLYLGEKAGIKPKKGSSKSQKSNTVSARNNFWDLPDTLIVPSSSAKKSSSGQSKVTGKTRRDLRSSYKYEDFSHSNKDDRVFSVEAFIDWYEENPAYYENKLYKIFSDFEIPKENRVGGNDRLSYDYLLLDPRKFSNFANVDWTDFINAIFYIGKGKNKRAYDHMQEAERYWKSGDYCAKAKIRKIHDIWRSKKPVMVLKIFENIVGEDACTREACMIDAIGKHRLCNQKCGTHYGAASCLLVREKRELGATLLIDARDILMRCGADRVRPKAWN